MSAYPSDFPLAESVEIVQLVRQGKVKEKLALFAKNLWTLQGYAMKATIGDPDMPVAQSLECCSKPCGFDAIAELEKMNVAAESGVTTQAMVPWKTILKWALDELVALLAA